MLPTPSADVLEKRDTGVGVWLNFRPQPHITAFGSFFARAAPKEQRQLKNVPDPLRRYRRTYDRNGILAGSTGKNPGTTGLRLR